MNDKTWWVETNDNRRGVIVVNRKKKFLGYLSASLVVVSLMVALNANPGRSETIGSAGQIIKAPTMAQLGQGCGGIMSWPSAPSDEIGYLQDGDFGFRVAPPTSGNFSTPWTGERFVKPGSSVLPSPQEALALQYRGWTVVWYREDADKTALSSLEVLDNALPADAKVLITPWPMDAETTWRKGRVIILAGWDNTEPCLTVNKAVVDQFQKNLKPAPGIDLPMDVPGPAAKTSTLERQMEESEAVK